WMKQASITMAEANDFGATSAITFEDIGSFLGFTDSTGTIPGDCTSGSCRIRFSNSVDWTVQDFETVALHELGHALGMDHSASHPARMFPSVSGCDRTLEPDDSVAVSTLWDTYWQLPGAAIDIGVGANGMVWVLGLEDRPYRFNVASGDWQPDVNNITALRIAVDSAGVPCVTTSSNQILCRSSND